MNRRDFIAKGISAGVFAGGAMTFGGFGSLVPESDTAYDLVAARGGDPVSMFDKSIESFGGIRSFVKKGQTVVIKPNIGWDVPAERAANTNPKLVARIIEHCLNAGAKDVYVFDYTCDNPQKCYANSGIEKAVKDAGGKIAPGNDEKYYHEVDIPKGKVLKKAREHELILSSDVFINVPVLKSHDGATLTISMKNLMGIIWDRRFYHQNDLHQCIADFVTYRKPDLNVVDAYRVVKRNGPRGVSEADVAELKSMVISTDIVAADAAATKFFGMEPQNIRHIKIAHEMGVGNMNLDQLKINRIKV